MTTPLSEWYDNTHKPKDQTLFQHICECMEEGEMSSLTWEQTLHAEPPLIEPDNLKQLCFDVWDVYFFKIEDILGNLDIDWEYAAKEYHKHIVKLCELQHDEALDELARMERKEREDFERFKKEVDRLSKHSQSCQISANEIRQMKDYQEKKIKKHMKMLSYIERQTKKVKAS